MTEKPILFSGAMVRAILDGSKTQTRRVVKPQPVYGDVAGTFASWMFKKRNGSGHWLYPNAKDVVLAECPYGVPADRLWVRETWSEDFSNNYPFEKYWYAADDDRRHEIHVCDGIRGIYSPEHGTHVPFRWRPSIHMPRSASRILLEITDVRVERLQDISETEAIAEGVRQHDERFSWVNECTLSDGKRHFSAGAYDMYRQLWNDLNAKRDHGWDVNPWVWVVSFKRVMP